MSLVSDLEFQSKNHWFTFASPVSGLGSAPYNCSVFAVDFTSRLQGPARFLAQPIVPLDMNTPCSYHSWHHSLALGHTPCYGPVSVFDLPVSTHTHSASIYFPSPAKSSGGNNKKDQPLPSHKAGKQADDTTTWKKQRHVQAHSAMLGPQSVLTQGLHNTPCKD